MKRFSDGADLPLWQARGTAMLNKVDRDDVSKHSRAKVLQALHDGLWHHTQEMVQIAGHRFSVGVNELRKRGHEIEVRPDGKSFEYRWVGRREKIQVPRTFQGEYYQSAHWKALRLDRTSMDDGRCCWCKTPYDLVVHHWRYDLFAERVKDLMTLCEGCHRALHAMKGVRIAFPTWVEPWMAERLGV